jgi:hypothetical protein
VDPTHHSQHARATPRVETSGLLPWLDVEARQGAHMRFADSDEGEGGEEEEGHCAQEQAGDAAAAAAAVVPVGAVRFLGCAVELAGWR